MEKSVKEFDLLGQKIRYFHPAINLDDAKIADENFVEVINTIHKFEEGFIAKYPHMTQHERAVLILLEVVSLKVKQDKSFLRELDEIQSLALETHQMLGEWCSPSSN